MCKRPLLLFFLLCTLPAWAQQHQACYWQQHVNYTMRVDMNVNTYRYQGTQHLVYTNNSPDTLHQVFYHLYYNAFQPGSQMDVRSRTIVDPDPRVMDRISKLSPDEIGYLKISNLKQDGQEIEGKTIGTIYQVKLAHPILPGEQSTLTLDFEGQVPLQIRRAGRNNAEGIALSMSQWYPKLAEYDYEGWHPDPYIAREFYGVWGDYEVYITIASDYIIGGSGYLQNPEEIGYGYQKNPNQKRQHQTDKLTWHFIAPRVHDFTWAADPDYRHDRVTMKDGTVLHFFYQDDSDIRKDWKRLKEDTQKLYHYFTTHIGPYPYRQYSFIQGGDGGMEYAMCTLIKDDKSYGSLLGTAAHEFAHSWFQFVLATNESEHPWMDEGMTTYISTLAMNAIYQKNPKAHPLKGAYKSYFRLANSGIEMPQTTHADRYKTNTNYGISSYSKGAIFLNQLEYIIGKENLSKTLHRYYELWQFKHPTPTDFIRVAEKVSGAQLRWYLNDWTRTTNSIDYGIKAVNDKGNKTELVLERIGLMPMPIELKITFTNGSTKNYYIPYRRMFWAKPFQGETLKSWGWAYPNYKLTLDQAKSKIERIEIDPSQRLADVQRENNVYPPKED